MTRQAADFLEAAVVAGLNILVAGGTQAGNPIHRKHNPTTGSTCVGGVALTWEGDQRVRAAHPRRR